MISIIIHTNPQPASRPRVPKYGKPYYPKAHTNAEKDYIKQLSVLKPAECPIFDPVTLSLDFYVKRPQRPSNPFPAPDIDNYCKLIMDAMSKVGYWKDDKQVTKLIASKQYSDNPKIIIKLVVDM